MLCTQTMNNMIMDSETLEWHSSLPIMVAKGGKACIVNIGSGPIRVAYSALVTPTAIEVRESTPGTTKIIHACAIPYADPGESAAFAAGVIMKIMERFSIIPSFGGVLRRRIKRNMSAEKIARRCASYAHGRGNPVFASGSLELVYANRDNLLYTGTINGKVAKKEILFFDDAVATRTKLGKHRREDVVKYPKGVRYLSTGAWKSDDESDRIRLFKIGIVETKLSLQLSEAEIFARSKIARRVVQCPG